MATNNTKKGKDTMQRRSSDQLGYDLVLVMLKDSKCFTDAEILHYAQLIKSIEPDMNIEIVCESVKEAVTRSNKTWNQGLKSLRANL
jgi:hypothetical protein